MAADLRLIIGRLAVLNSIKEYTLAPVFTYHLSACFPPLIRGDRGGFTAAKSLTKPSLWGGSRPENPLSPSFSKWGRGSGTFLVKTDRW